MSMSRRYKVLVIERDEYYTDSYLACNPKIVNAWLASDNLENTIERAENDARTLIGKNPTKEYVIAVVHSVVRPRKVVPVDPIEIIKVP